MQRLDTRSESSLTLDGKPLSFADLARIGARAVSLEADPAAMLRVDAARRVVDDRIARGEPVYGANTGRWCDERRRGARGLLAAQAMDIHGDRPLSAEVEVIESDLGSDLTMAELISHAPFPHRMSFSRSVRSRSMPEYDFSGGAV